MVQSEYNTRMCDICYNEIDLAEVKQFSRCGHIFCTKCICEHYRFKIEDQNLVKQIKCPQYGCPRQATEEEIKQIVSTDTFQKMQKYMFNHLVLEEKDLMFCTSPGCEQVL